MKRQQIFRKLITIAMAAGMMLMTACGGTTQPAAEAEPAEVKETAGDSEFDFVGSETYEDGVTYTFHIVGEPRTQEEGNPFVLTIDELPQFQLTGNYTYVDQKGYKLYFADADQQFVYTSYDPETKAFSFKYKLDLGEALGKRTVPFTYTNEAFVASYDGEGLGITPPVLEGGGWGGYIGQFEIAPAKLTCYEDGTAVFTAEAVTAVDTKTGTREYDEEKNQYHFNFPAQQIANNSQNEERDGVLYFETVYGEGDYQYDNPSDVTDTDFYTEFDEATGTYSLDLQIVWYVYSIIHLEFTL